MDQGLGPSDNLADGRDVCVVGSGPVGLAVALACARKGLSVTLLESGGGKQGDAGRDLTAYSIVDPRFHAPADLTTHRGLGGASHLWGGRCVTFDQLDFERRHHVPYSGWPLEARELTPYYREAHTFLGAVDDRSARPIDQPPPGRMRLDKTEVWSKQPRIHRVHARELQDRKNIDVRVGATVTGLLVRAEQDALAGLQVNENGRTSTIRATSYVLACGGRENARLLLNVRAKWPGFLGGSEGPLGRYYMGHLAGSIAAIEFNRAEDAALFFFERAPSGSYVRRRLQVAEHLQEQRNLFNASMWVNSLPIHDDAHGSGALSLVHLWRRARSEVPVHGGSDLRMHVKNILADPVRSLSDALGVFRRRLMQQQLPHFFLPSPRQRYMLRYQAEHAPSRESKVTLDHERDALGVQRVKADLRFSDPDFSSVVATHHLLANWLAAAGVGRLIPEVGDERELVFEQACDGYHQIGLTRMAQTPREGVVDLNCRVFGVPNLYIAGSSVFSTSGEANPTLPAVAFGLRLAEHLTSGAN